MRGHARGGKRVQRANLGVGGQQRVVYVLPGARCQGTIDENGDEVFLTRASNQEAPNVYFADSGYVNRTLYKQVQAKLGNQPAISPGIVLFDPKDGTGFQDYPAREVVRGRKRRERPECCCFDAPGA